jgi:O-glycosyl hydrolase
MDEDALKPSALRAVAGAAASRCRALLTRLRLVAPPAPRTDTRTDTLLLSQRHQTIEHFGASDAWVVQSLPPGSAVAARCAELLFSASSGAALSCWRVNLGGGINHATIDDPLRTCDTFETGPRTYDWRRNAAAVSFMRAAVAAGVPHVLFFANSPPSRLTRNGRTNCDDDATSCNLRPGAEREFAAYLADIALHFARGGGDEEEAPVPLVAVTPLNEPQWRWTSGQEGCRASNADIVRVVAALRATLDDCGLHDVAVAAPDSGSLPDMWRLNTAVAAAAGGVPFGAYAKALTEDATASAALAGLLTYHSYWSDDVASALIQNRTTLAAALPPGWRLWCSEYCLMDPPSDGDARMLGMDAALRVARIIHFDLTRAGATAWHWWLGVSCYDFPDGLLYVPRGDAMRPDDASCVTATKRLWALAHFSRFVRPGFTRVRLDTDDDPCGVMASAYVSSDETTAVMVYINASDAPSPPRMLVVELPAAAAQAVPLLLRRWLTDEAHDCEEVASLPHKAPLGLPPRSITTLLAVVGGQRA